MEPLPNPPASGMDPTKKLETDGISVFTIQYQNKEGGGSGGPRVVLRRCSDSWTSFSAVLW